MIVRGDQRVLVQGITGRQGTYWTERMQAYGTRIVAGVNPKKAGTLHCGVPVFASAGDAMREVGFDVSVLFIPPLGVKAAAQDAIEAGCARLVILAEHVPVQDVMEILAMARANAVAVVGPNTAGLVTPGECFVGFMPAFETDIFQRGRVAVISRSGSLGTLVCLNLVQAGFGQSAFIGIGGDPIIGTTTRDALQELDADDRTRCGRGGRRDRRDDGGRRGGIRAGHVQARRRLHRGQRGTARKEDGPRRRDRDGRQGHLRIEAQGARSGRGRGARHPLRGRARASVRGSAEYGCDCVAGLVGYDSVSQLAEGEKLMTDANQPEVHRGLKDLCFDRSPTTLIDGRPASSATAATLFTISPRTRRSKRPPTCCCTANSRRGPSSRPSTGR